MQLSTRPSRPTSAGDRARLRLEGVEAAIVTRVARRREGALVVVQELPFLRRNARALDEDGRSARISRVAIDADGEVPKLVLELAYEDDVPVEVDPVSVAVDPVSARWDRRDQTLGYGETREIVRRDSQAPKRPRESTLMFRTEAPLARADQSVRTTAPWMERRGSEIELAWRAFVMRVESAIAHLARGLAQAFTALRTDP